MLGNFIPEHGHPTALFLLELLLNHRAPIPVHYLYWASCNNSGNPINPYALGFSVTGAALTEFIDFLQSFPSLFVVIGNYVYPAGSLDFDHSRISYPAAIYPCADSSAEVSSSTPTVSILSEPILRKKTVDFFQNVLMTWGYNLYYPIQRIFGCLSYVNPLIRAAFPTTKTLSSFLHQYPDIFHFRDGLVGLTKLNRMSRYISQKEGSADFQASQSGERICSINNGLKIEVLISPSQNFDNATKCTLPASDFSVILVLRRILRPAGNTGLHVALVIKELITFPYDVEKVIGLTRFELYAFVEKYRQFFLILSSTAADTTINGNINVDCKEQCRTPNSFYLRIQPGAWHMKSRLIDSRRSSVMTNNSSKLDQHMGRVFRVAKSWGIIDLGNHVHVFFDKSIFRNVSDLQKVFQPNEFVYFDAVRAPLRSRAKWRAIRVWKPDDHDILQHFQSTQVRDDDEVTVTCFPFLAPSKIDRRRGKMQTTRVESMPTLMRTSLRSTSKSSDPPRRCCSLERMTLSNFSLKFDDDHGSQQDFNPYSTFYPSDDDDEDLNLNDLKLFCDTTDLDGFLSPDLYDSSVFSVPARPHALTNSFSLNGKHDKFDFDSLKRPLKLLHDTGGMLADLEFPDSDISWTPELDSVSMASPNTFRAINPDSTVYCPLNTFPLARNHASTQTCFGDTINSTCINGI